MKTNTYMNFAKRFVMVLAIGLMAVNVWGAYSGTFNRISSLSEISDGDSVLVVIQDAKTTANGYAVRNNSTITQSVEINGTSITCTQAECVWKVTINNSDYSFQRGTGQSIQYIAYISSTTLSGTGTTSNTYTWGITALDGYTGYFMIKTSGGRYISVNSTPAFKAYAYEASNQVKFVNQFETDPAVALKQYDGAVSIYKKGAATHTVTINRNNNAYGTVSQASVSNLANNTSISASGNVLTIGTTTVTATPTAQDADYNYAFTNWSNIPAGGKVTGNITVTANFTRTARSYVNYRTKCCTPLDAPTNVEVSVTGTQAATVTWDAVTDATGYEYKLGDGEWTDTEVAGDAASPKLSLTGLTSATGHTIYLRTNGSGDNCAEGTAADAVAFKTWATVTAASNDDLMGTAQVSLNGEDWASSVAAADGTKIYLKATAEEGYEWYEWATPASGSINEDNEFTGWEGNVTVTANFRTKSLVELGVPTGMASNSVTAISAVVSWTAVENASGYAVTCEKTDDHSTEGIVIGDIDGTSCTITGLTANTGYTWTVKAVGDNSSYKDGDACEGQTFTTDKKKPATVEITTAPSKTTYNSGEAFDATGMVVKVTYNNGDIDAAYTGYTVSPSTALSPSNTYVTVTATMNEASASVEQAITVNAKLTWKAAGAEDVTTYASSGKVVMPTGDNPSAPSCLGDFDTFQGWSASAISVSTDVEPSYVSEETDAAADATFYAVFAKMGDGDVEDENSTFTVKGVSAPGSPYVADDGATWTYSSVTFGNTNPGFAANSSAWIQVTLPENATEAVDYTITQGNSWAGTAKSKLTSGSTEITDITGSSLSYDFTSSNKSLGTYKLANVSSTTKGCWIDHITINYKKVGQVPVEWATTCCTPWDAPAISYSVPSGWKKNDDAVEVEIASGDTYGSVSYESSNTAVLTVAADGSITAVAPGTATVTATWAGATIGSVKYCEASSVSAEIEVSGTVTVKFDGNGNDNGSMSDQEITYKTATNLTSNAFCKTGYSFGGWAESAAAAAAKTVLYTNGQEVTLTAGCTLYAIWNINSHAVTLTQPTGNTIEATGAANLASVAYGTEITLTATENDGYVFTGWNAEGVVLANTNPIVFTMPDNDVTVTATYSTYTWENASPRYTVTTAPKIVYNKVETFSTAGVVIKENFKRSDDNTITKQVAYNGAWTATLNDEPIANGDALSLDNDGQTLKLYIGELEIASYTLTVNDIPTDQFIDNLWGNATQLMVGEYTVPDALSATANEVDCPDNNVFVGWVLAANEENPTDDNLVLAGTTGQEAANRTYYAVWAKQFTGPKEFTLHYGWDVGETLPSGWSVCNATATSSADIAAHDKTNCVSTANDYNPIIRTGLVASPKKMTIWIARVSNNTSNTEFAIQTCASQNGTYADIAVVTMNATTKNEWYKFEADLSDKENVYVQIVKRGGGSAVRLFDDVTLTYEAEDTWNTEYRTDCLPLYHVTFDVNGAEDGSYEALDKKAGVEITLPNGSALVRAHHTFLGWTEDQAGAGTLYTTTYTVPANDVTLYAQWTEDHHAFVHFMDGENEVAGSPIKVYDGGTYNLLAALEAENKEFIGWSYGGEVKAGGLTNQHMSNPAEDKTYTAEWMTMLPKPNADVDLTGGKWILVKDANQLNAGDFIVIAAAEYNMAMSTTQNNANRQGVAVSKSNDTLSFATNVNVAPLFLQYDEQTGFYTLYDRAWNNNAGGYLFSNNNLNTQSGITMQALWSITIADKKATLEAQGDNTERVIRYNASNEGIFADYNGAAASTKDVAIYKWYKTLAAGTTDVNAVEWTDAIIVPNGATLNVNSDASLESVIVEAGGKVSGSATLNVQDMTINSEAGKSGQVTGSDVHINGDIYLDIKLLDGTGTMTTEESQMWYCISAPFEVSFNDGFFWGNGTPMGHNVDFQAFVYDGAKRASNGTSGWQRAGGKMEAGKAYLIGFDDERSNQKTIRLKAMLNTIPTASALPTEAHYNEDDAQANWNGVGNPTLHYIALDGFAGKVQCYNNGAGYSPYDPATHNYVVGTALFMQADDNIDLKAATNANFRAPKRESEEDERYSFCVEIAKEGATRCDNRLYVSTSDEATSTYEQGKDMQSMNGTSAKFAALIWTENYGMRLASEDVPMVNQKASYTLGIYAPKAGTYSISTVEASEDAELYLTYNGRAIWNLSMSECELELAQGQNAGYGLRLVVKAPAVVTGVDQIDAKAGAQKVIIDEHVYILRGGQMYDVNGKLVK